MHPVTQILVGVDFSRASLAALDQAVRIGRETGAQITALYVISIPIYSVPPQAVFSFSMPELTIALDDAKSQWRGVAAERNIPQSVHGEIVIGSARIELIDRARATNSNLLVVGAHGDRDAAKGIGVTAAACVEHAPGNVLIVREQQSGPFRAILACVDFSETSRIAVEEAVHTANRDDATLVVLHVYPDPLKAAADPAALLATMPDFAENYHDAVVARLKAFTPLVPGTHAEKIRYIAFQADSHAQGILDFIAPHQIDLVVLGTRSNWNARDFLFGTTAERVVRRVGCSVLAVKPPAMGPTHASKS